MGKLGKRFRGYTGASCCVANTNCSNHKKIENFIKYDFSFLLLKTCFINKKTFYHKQLLWYHKYTNKKMITNFSDSILNSSCFRWHRFWWFFDGFCYNFHGFRFLLRLTCVDIWFSYWFIVKFEVFIWIQRLTHSWLFFVTCTSKYYTLNLKICTVFAAIPTYSGVLFNCIRDVVTFLGIQ